MTNTALVNAYGGWSPAGWVGMTTLIEALAAIVGESGLVDPDDYAAYVKGARYGNGVPACVVRPATTDEVAAVVALCARRRVTVVPQGANSGLVGGSTPDESGTQVVLSLTRMRNRCAVDHINRTVEVDAGLLLHELNDRLQPFGLWFPVDLAADPTIGGMVATNTGGTRLLRYGDVRHNLLSVEAVLFEPPGQVVRLGRPLRKNNSGFDLMQLFVGTSGAAGIVTAATLEVAVRPQQTVTALLVPSSDDAVANLLVAAETELGDFLSAFEGMSAAALQAAFQHVHSLRNPFGEEPIPEFTILVELSSSSIPGPGAANLESLLVNFLESQLGIDLGNAVLGRGDELWRLRHSLSEGARGLGHVIGLDVSVRRSDVMRFRREATALVHASYPQLEVVDFGHIGDGGLHFNLVWRKDCSEALSLEVIECARSELYELVVGTFAGSFSAEHGVGPHNHSTYLKHTSPPVQRLAGTIQNVLDPYGVSGGVRFGLSSVNQVLRP